MNDGIQLSGHKSLSASARDLVWDFASCAGRRGIWAIFYISASALLESAGISLLVPLLDLIFGTGALPPWFARSVSFAFLAFGANTTLQRLLLLLGAFGTLTILRAVVVSAREIATFRLQVDFVRTQQMRATRNLAAARWEYLARFRHSRITHLMSGDIQRLGIGVHFVLHGVTAFAVIAAQCALAFVLAPALAAILLLSLAAGFAAFGPALSRARAIGSYVDDTNLSLLNSTAQFLGGLKLAVSQNLERNFVDEVRETLSHLTGQQIRFVKQNVVSQAILTIALGFFAAGAILAGLFWFHTAPSLLIAVLLIVVRMTGPIGQLQQGAQQFANLLATYEKIRLLGDELAFAAREDSNYPEVSYPEGPVVFENVSYRHTGSATEEVQRERAAGLRNFSFTIAPGEFLAITGASGAGKTTFADILAGLFPPQSGAIIAGGHVLERATLAVWRRDLAYASQDSFLFHDTIRRNFSWANPDARETDMWRVLQAVGADGLVRRLDKGLETVVGERGALVSGGERQRLALARALLRRPRLLILDEATSAIDPEGEGDILTSVRALCPRTTIVLIAHRTDNLTACDRIVRLEIAGENTVARTLVARNAIAGEHGRSSYLACRP